MLHSSDSMGMSQSSSSGTETHSSQPVLGQAPSCSSQRFPFSFRSYQVVGLLMYYQQNNCHSGGALAFGYFSLGGAGEAEAHS